MAVLKQETVLIVRNYALMYVLGGKGHSWQWYSQTVLEKNFDLYVFYILYYYFLKDHVLLGLSFLAHSEQARH